LNLISTVYITQIGRASCRDNYIITHYILHLDYCSTIWGEIIVKNTERITKFTKKISPHYSKLWYFNSIKFYVLSLLDDYHFQIVFKIKIKIVFMYKIINGQDYNNIHDLIIHFSTNIKSHANIHRLHTINEILWPWIDICK
jgi:hypothetical protein